jgi:hypothetical protein
MRKDLALLLASLAFLLAHLGESAEAQCLGGSGENLSGLKTLSVPIRSIKKPAEDLMDRNGRLVDVGMAAQMARQGIDISEVLVPKDDRFWQNRKYSARGEDTPAFPEAGATLEFAGNIEYLNHLFGSAYAFRVRSPENPSLFYRIGISRVPFSILARAALLRKLGYYVIPPKMLSEVRIQFANEEEKEIFKSETVASNNSFVLSDDYILEDDKTNHSLRIAGVLIELQDNKIPEWYRGRAPPRCVAETALVQFWKSRPFRAAIIPLSLVEIPESLNRFSSQMCQIQGGFLSLFHPDADSFEGASFEDLRWVTRRILELNNQDIEDIVNETQLPDCLKPVFRARLIDRIYNLSECMNLRTQFRLTRMDVKEINTCHGLVQKGKVMQKKIAPYPQRFSHGDLLSPYNDGDLFRFLRIETYTSAISSVLTKFSTELLQLATSEQAVNNRKKELTDRLVNHIRTKPKEPLFQPVESWGGPLAGGAIKASRHVSTGTFFQSTAAVQLVDNLTVNGNVGYFWAFDGFKTWQPLVNTAVQYARDFTHVRPVAKMAEAAKVSWRDLWVPTKLDSLGKLVNGASADPLSELLEQLKIGEVFLVTESMTVGLNTNVSAPIDVLTGISPLGYLNSVGLSADLSRTNLKQMSLTRTERGIEVYLRNIDPVFAETPEGKEQQNKWAMTVAGITFDVNFYLNILKLRSQFTEQNLRTDAFIIPLDEGAFVGQSNEQIAQFKKNLSLALGAALRGGDYSLFFKYFNNQKFRIEHDLKTQQFNLRLAWWRVSKFNECHGAKLQLPRTEAMGHLTDQDLRVDLFGCKVGELRGHDLLGFGLDSLDAVLQNKNPNLRLDRLQVLNPANAPLGKAYWKVINSESVVESPEGNKPKMSSIQHVWGGWSMKTKELLRLLEQIENEMQFEKIAHYRLLVQEQLAHVSEIQFYRISRTLSILEGGVDKIRDLVLQPDSGGKSIPRERFFLSRVFQRLSAMGKTPRLSDKELLEDIQLILGQGDSEKGRKIYMQQCKEEKTHPQELNASTAAWRKGVSYECLSGWVAKLMTLAQKYPQNDIKKQTQWATEVLSILEDQVPLPLLMNYLGEKNYLFVFNIFGFRKGDEDGDLEIFGNGPGIPSTREEFQFAGGIFKHYCGQTGVSCIELDRSNGGFQ